MAGPWYWKKMPASLDKESYWLKLKKGDPCLVLTLMLLLVPLPVLISAWRWLETGHVLLVLEQFCTTLWLSWHCLYKNINHFIGGKTRLWFACHCDSDKLQEMPRVEKPVDGEKVLKFTCRDFLKALYEYKSKCQRKPEFIVQKMQLEFGHVRECFDGLD